MFLPGENRLIAAANNPQPGHKDVKKLTCTQDEELWHNPSQQIEGQSVDALGHLLRAPWCLFILFVQ